MMRKVSTTKIAKGLLEIGRESSTPPKCARLLLVAELRHPMGDAQKPGPTLDDGAGAAGMPGAAICASAPTSCMHRS